jgi:hypothetical protein
MKNENVRKVLDKINEITQELIKIGPCDLKSNIKQRIKDLEEAQAKYQSDGEGKT